MSSIEAEPSQETSFSSCVVENKPYQEMHSPVAGLIFSSTHNLMVEQGIAFWEEFVKKQQERRKTEALYETSTLDHSNGGQNFIQTLIDSVSSGLSTSLEESSKTGSDKADEKIPCDQSECSQQVHNQNERGNGQASHEDKNEQEAETDTEKSFEEKENEQVDASDVHKERRELPQQRQSQSAAQAFPSQEVELNWKPNVDKAPQTMSEPAETTIQHADAGTPPPPKPKQAQRHKRPSGSSKEERKAMRHEAGIGVRLQRVRGATVVVEVAHGGPAQKTLRPGDVILAVDGELTDSLSLDAVLAKLRGPTGTLVHLSVLSKHRSTIPLLVRVCRDRLPPAKASSSSRKTFSIEVKSQNAAASKEKKDADSSVGGTQRLEAPTNELSNCISIGKLQNCLLARLLEGSITIKNKQQEATERVLQNKQQEAIEPVLKTFISEEKQNRKRLSITASGFDEDEFEPIDMEQDQKFLELATMTRHVSIQSPTCTTEPKADRRVDEKGAGADAHGARISGGDGGNRTGVKNDEEKRSTKKRKSMEVPRPKDHLLEPQMMRPQHQMRTMASEENKSFRNNEKKTKKSRIEEWAENNLKPSKDNVNKQPADLHSSEQTARDYLTYDSLQQRANQYVSTVKRSPSEALQTIDSLLSSR
ncbi:hypothetical protein GUITHDRAFT_109508 [Guillardia theta CCMP2712]|uniref:PDZ domain-containing protein n=1 Tax=Guillardia theta (strain CCMP2712) TaxID=905079 RepID=L1J9F1_GUITC|nr:hypothetical protein GUITHDRAFT_109508 [Guillardia theta CCMP2712]EKX44729.1 hypothetical protein GUITHDRAFT_109508 [Guillardia theta CCMP2712]|eukprot:XP_005831709.1 hypothetical protein GUITHDRAFT_109508 [Guillardia theta CCMP2712]